MAYSYEQGNVVRVTATFTNPLDDSAVDPAVVNFSLRTPCGGVTTFVYATDPEVVRSDVGEYYMDVSLESPGTWYVRAWSSETYIAAEELTVTVTAHVAIA